MPNKKRLKRSYKKRPPESVTFRIVNPPPDGILNFPDECISAFVDILERKACEKLGIPYEEFYWWKAGRFQLPETVGKASRSE